MKIYMISLIIILFTGCSNMLDISPTHIQKNVRNLEPGEMKIIYKTILDEMNFQKEKADKAHFNGYNSDAVAIYENINYCMGYEYIPIKKIDNIKQLCKYNSDYHYKEAIIYLKKNKKRALLELNSLLNNNPKHKDGLKYLTQLKKTKEIKDFIYSLETELKTALANNNNSSIKDIKRIVDHQKKLILYDNKNPLIKKAEDVLSIEHDKLVKNVTIYYNKGDITLAKKNIEGLLYIYEKDSIAEHYLAKIDSEAALNQGNCFQAIKLSRKVLKIDSKDKKAKKILTISESKCKEKISIILQDAIKQYNDNNIRLASQSFQKVLKLDPNNNTSLIYTKKIDSQLKTIKSLK